MARTNESLVKGVLMSDYGPKSDGTLPSLSPFITVANLIVTRVVACAVRKDILLSTAEAQAMETWIAAHAYQQSDQAEASKGEAGANASFQGQTGMYLEGTKYGQMALTIDPSGCLRSLTKYRRADAAWLGKATSDQIPIDQRN